MTSVASACQSSNPLHQIYQFLIERLRVLAHSDLPIEPRDQISSAPHVSQGDPINAKRDEMDDAFDSIAPPKKVKTSHETPACIASSSSTTASSSSVTTEPVRDLIFSLISP